MLKLKRAFEIYNKSQEGITPKENGNKKSKKKMFHHNSMVRYDNTALDDNAGPLFVCKNCLRVSLNEETARSHLNNCTGRNKNVPTQKVLKEKKTLKTVPNVIAKVAEAPKVRDAPKARPRPIVSPEPYICTCCNLAFKRKVTYDQHIKNKINKIVRSSMSDSISTSSDESPQMRRKYYKKKIERDPTFYPDEDY